MDGAERARLDGDRTFLTLCGTERGITTQVEQPDFCGEFLLEVGRTAALGIEPRAIR